MPVAGWVNFIKEKNIYSNEFEESIPLSLVAFVSVDNDIIEQVKNIATNEGCDVKIDTCYQWLVIKDKKQTINQYF